MATNNKFTKLRLSVQTPEGNKELFGYLNIPGDYGVTSDNFIDGFKQLMDKLIIEEIEDQPKTSVVKSVFGGTKKEAEF